MIKGQLYTGMWLPLSWDIKHVLCKKFGLIKTGQSVVVDNTIQADGFGDDQLCKINVESLQKELGSTVTDFFHLWSMMLDKVEAELHPKPVETPKVEEKVEETPKAQPKRKYVKKVIKDTTEGEQD